MTRFTAVFPDGHQHEGRIAQRRRMCPRCRLFFPQFQVSRDWLDSLRPGARESYLEACETHTDGTVWQPTHCAPCGRLRLTVPVGPRNQNETVEERLGGRDLQLPREPEDDETPELALGGPTT